MTTKKFWKDALERTIRTGAQVLLGLITVDGISTRLNVPVKELVVSVLLTMLACLLMSLVATDGKSASFIKK